jgi:outer membrane immunogenic protein
VRYIYTPAVPAVYVPPPYNWTGFYIGVNAGYGAARATSDLVWNGAFGLFTLTSTGNSATLAGGIAGGQLGYNYQAGPAVFGVELDGQWSGQKKDIVSFCGFFCTVDETVKINSFGTLRGRIGVAFDRILLYGTAGAAWISANDNVTANGFNVLSVSGSKVGGAAGIGIEAGVSGGFSIKAEYLYMQVNGISGSAPAPFAGGTITETAKIQDHIFRIGGNYRF